MNARVGGSDVLRSVRSDTRPLSSRVAEELTRILNSGAYPPGSKLPPEPRLAEQLDVSRATVREALKLLEYENLVERRQGVGTIVMDPGRLLNNLEQNFGVTDLIRSYGLTPGTKRVKIRQLKATRDVANRLHIETGAPLIWIERVRSANRRPVIVSTDVMAMHLAPADPEAVFRTTSIYSYLEKERGVVITHGIATVSPARANSRIADLMQISRGRLLLRLEQIDFDRTDRPVLLSDELHDPETFVMRIRRRGPGR